MSFPGAGWMLLAQAEARRHTTAEAWWLLLALTAVVIVAFIVAGIVIYVVRSRALKEETTKSDVPLTLHEVREMRARGEIDDAEMEKLKGIVMTQTRQERPKPPPPSEGAP